MTISKPAADLLEARERLQRLKDEHRKLLAVAKEAEDLLTATKMRIRQLAGSTFDRHGEIASAEDDVKKSTEALRRQSLPPAIWSTPPNWEHFHCVVTRVTPKRIYVGDVDSMTDRYHDRDTGMRGTTTYDGVLDVPATLASIEQHAAANQPPLKGK